MKVVVTPRAEADIEHQHTWGVRRYGKHTADRTYRRVAQFIEGTIAHRPRTGSCIKPPDIYESWIPRTPSIVYYRVEDATDTVWVLALLHHAQDRRDFDPE